MKRITLPFYASFCALLCVSIAQASSDPNALSIMLSDYGVVTPGQRLTLDISIANVSDQTVAKVELQGSLDPNIHLIALDHDDAAYCEQLSCSWPSSPLGPGEEFTLILSLSSDAEGVYPISLKAFAIQNYQTIETSLDDVITIQNLQITETAPLAAEDDGQSNWDDQQNRGETISLEPAPELVVESVIETESSTNDKQRVESSMNSIESELPAEPVALTSSIVFEISKGMTLRENLTEWCRQAGWEDPVWDTNIDYQLTTGAFLEMDFEKAVDTLLELVNTNNKLDWHGYRSNKILRVWESSK